MNANSTLNLNSMRLSATATAAVTAVAVLALLTSAGAATAHAQEARVGENGARAVAQPEAAAPGQAAAAVTLKNLTLVGNTVAAGDAACPAQPYYLYSGGKPDNFAGPADLAYPSVPLKAIMAPGTVVGYDMPMADGRFGDSFNLQHTRGVCHALIQFRAKPSQAGSTNDGLTLGHVTGPAGPWAIVAQVINPGGSTAVQSYALDATGRSNLSALTGWALDKTRDQSALDVFLQDDTQIDFFRIFIWYGPHCTTGSNQANC